MTKPIDTKTQLLQWNYSWNFPFTSDCVI